MRSVTSLLLLLAWTGASAAVPPAPVVALTREGGAFRLKASFEARAPVAAAWAVLTDYAGMPRFVRSLKKSRVMRQDPEGPVIEQEGVARLAIFSRRISLTLKVLESPPAHIEFRDIADKEFEEYEGDWTIAESSGAVRVSYQLFAEMKSSLVPRSLARQVLERSVRDQMKQLQTEIERRGAPRP